MSSANSSSASALRATTLRTAEDFDHISGPLAELRHCVGNGDDMHSDPEYVLACGDLTRRIFAVACWRGQQLVGVVFSFKHYTHGIATGYAVAGDYSGRGGMVARAEDAAEVASAAVDHLLRHGVHSLQLRLSPAPPSEPVFGALRTRNFREQIPGDRLPLASTYEGFLAHIGKHTRRNIRAYTRRASAAGITFDPHITAAEYSEAVHRLGRVSEFPIAERRLARDLRLVRRFDGCSFGLRDRSGTIVSVLCGFSVRNRFHILSQVNDASLHHLSLSLVLRGRTIRHLIEFGQREVQFIGGTSLALGRFCERLDYSSWFIDRPHPVYSAMKVFAARLVDLLAALHLCVPSELETFSGTYLAASRLTARTPLMPAAVVKLEILHRTLKHSSAAGPVGVEAVLAPHAAKPPHVLSA